MPTYTKGKIPWFKIGFVVLCIVLVFIGVGVLLPGAGAAMVGGFIGFWIGVYEFFFVVPTAMSTVVAIAMTTGVLVLITQRKYFFKQKISNANIGTTSTLQGAPIQTSVFSNPPSVAQIVQPVVDPNKVEVTTSA
jgi:hypothetical protein